MICCCGTPVITWDEDHPGGTQINKIQANGTKTATGEFEPKWGTTQDHPGPPGQKRNIRTNKSPRKYFEKQFDMICVFVLFVRCVCLFAILVIIIRLRASFVELVLMNCFF